MVNISEEVDHSRWSEYLQEALELVGEGSPVRVLRKSFESDYQGFVDVDVLLANGKVFSYYYSYGSCSGCDSWEGYEDTVVQEMVKEATIFESLREYELWIANKHWTDLVMRPGERWH